MHENRGAAQYVITPNGETDGCALEPGGHRSVGKLMLAVKRARERARERGRYPRDFVNVSDHLGSIRRVGCRTINHWQLGARKPYGVRLFGVFALVQVGFKFPFGESASVNLA